MQTVSRVGNVVKKVIVSLLSDPFPSFCKEQLWKLPYMVGGKHPNRTRLIISFGHSSNSTNHAVGICKDNGAIRGQDRHGKGQRVVRVSKSVQLLFVRFLEVASDVPCIINRRRAD